MLCKKMSAFAVAVMLVVAAQASAALVTFTSRAEFNASSTSVTNTSFDSLVTVPGTDLWLPNDSVVQGVRMRNAGGFYAKNNEAPWSPGLPVVITGIGNYATQLWVDENPNRTAVAIDLYVGGTGTHPIDGYYTTSDGLTHDFSFAGTNLPTVPYFLGIASTDPTLKIDGIRLNADSGDHWQPAFAGVSYGLYQAVPEPSALVLLGFGMFSLLAYAWRKRR